MQSYRLVVERIFLPWHVYNEKGSGKLIVTVTHAVDPAQAFEMAWVLLCVLKTCRACRQVAAISQIVWQLL